MEFRCEFPDRARCRLFGSVNPDGMRGLYLDRAAKDESTDIRQGFHMSYSSKVAEEIQFDPDLMTNLEAWIEANDEVPEGAKSQ